MSILFRVLALWYGNSNGEMLHVKYIVGKNQVNISVRILLTNLYPAVLSRNSPVTWKHCLT